jgi:hypothetical protein
MPLDKQDLKLIKGIVKEVIKKELVGFAKKEDFKQFAKKSDLKNFATKDDLKGFAKKDDLKNFATKDDLKRFATKDDLANFAMKDDLKKLESRMATKNDLIKLELKMATKDDLANFATKDDIKRLESKIDSTKDELVMTIDELRISTAEGFEDVQGQLQEHGKRFDKIDAELIEIKAEQENVKLRMDQLAPKFEVVDLKKRVTKIEKVVGV